MLLKQSTARSAVVLMIDAADHVTGKTGLTLTITASKDGGAFASISPTVTELATGWYKLALTTSHTDTLGDLALHVTSAGADPTDIVYQVVVELPQAVPTNFATLSIDGSGRVDVAKVAGTAQTARDLGASVLISSGTGTGQVSVTAGVIKANLAQILGTAITETAGQIAAAFKAFFDVSSPTLTAQSVNQTGDSYARIGAPAGASIAADIDAVPTAVENADALLKRDWNSVTGEASRSVLNALRFLRNAWTIVAGVLTVTRENDSTPAWTGAVTTDAAADPIVGNDPT